MADMNQQPAWHAGTGLPAVYIVAVEAIAAYFDGKPGADALLLIASFARGKGDLALGSDCDLVLLHDHTFAATAELPAYEAWLADRAREWQLDRLGRYSGIDLDLHNGRFAPKPRGWTSGPDDFELEIGNTLVYSRPVRQWTDRFERLRAQWLPYYSDKLRATRLAEALKYARNDLDHIPVYAERGLYFQCLKRLHHAVEETVQALFIAARTYPIAYDKWVEEQVSEILGRPDLYTRLVQVVTIPELSAPVLRERAALLSAVLDGISSAEPST
jgi:hypothetical protein